MLTPEEISVSAAISMRAPASLIRGSAEYVYGLIKPLGFKFNLFIKFV